MLIRQFGVISNKEQLLINQCLKQLERDGHEAPEAAGSEDDQRSIEKRTLPYRYDIISGILEQKRILVDALSMIRNIR